MTSPRDVVALRRAEREGLLQIARDYVAGLDRDLDVVAAVVVGSVARGDFHDASDVDVLVIARRLPTDAGERWELIAPPHGVVQAIAWTPAEWDSERARDNPLAVDALAHGMWLVGSHTTL